MKKHQYTLSLLSAILFSIIFHISAYGQMSAGKEFDMPSAKVWNFIKYGSGDPSLYTGAVRISIPFYTYKDSEFEVSVSCNYLSDGMRPNTGTGEMGHGWSLNVGGCITREIRGIPDEYSNTALTVPPLAPDIYYPSTSSDGVHVIADGFMLTRKLDYESILTSSLWTPRWYGTDVISYYLQYNTNNLIAGHYYDVEPDIFHFNFMGHSGEFYMWHNDKIVIYNSNEATGTFKVDISDDQLRNIQITTGNGYRYVFGYIAGSNYESAVEKSGYGYIDEVTSECDVIVTWYLSQVIAPNGRVMYYDYTPISNNNYNIVTYSPSSLYMAESSLVTRFGHTPIDRNISNGAIISSETKKITQLNRIYFPDTNSEIKFDYYSKNEIAREVNCHDADIDRYIYKLKNIIALNNYADTVYKCTLGYISSNLGNRITFLDHINISGEGVYKFDYIGVKSGNYVFPKFGTFSVDHWGYYNGKLNGADDYSYNFADPSMFNLNTATYDETILSTNRSYNNSLAQLGMLSKMTFPTNGYAAFTYEPHTYSKHVDRTSSTGFQPLLKTDVSNSETGGLRIKLIAEYDENGVLLTSKNYTYTLENNTLSSGVLLYMPRYNIWYNKNTGTSPYHIYYVSANDVNSYSKQHIEYSRVVETDRDGGKTVYNYENYSTKPDILQSIGTIQLNYRGFSSSGTVSEVSAQTLLSPLTSKQYARGRLLEKLIYRSDNELLRREKYIYANDNINTVASIEKAGEICKKYYKLLGCNKIVTQITTSYTNNGNIIERSDNTYDSYGRLSAVAGNSSVSNKTHRTTYTYPDQMGALAIYKSMIHRNMLLYPVIKYDYYNENIVEGLKYQYDSIAADNVPYIITLSAVQKYDIDQLQWYTDYSYLYDKLGHIIQSTDRNNFYTSYIWGYNGMYTVAKVNNATIAAIRSISGLSNINNIPLSSGIDNYENSLRALSGAEVTTFSYKPLVGLTKITYPSGRTQTQSYNSEGKLYKMYDEDGKTIKKINYSTDKK